MMKRLTALMVLMTLTACDYAEKYDFRRERKQRAYQEAMADYQAGRIDSAIAGLQKVVRADPGNAPARFQLGCLLQDARKDHLEALCAYHEYVLQYPDSDKARLARERSEACLRELAVKLPARFALGKSPDLAKLVESLRKELKATENREAQLKKELDASRTRADALALERERLMAMIKGEGVEDTSRPKVENIKDLLNEDEEDRKLLAESPNGAPPAKVSGEAKELLADNVDLETAKMATDLSELKGHGKPVERKSKPAPEGPKHETRPEKYVVQEGDTLMRIAIRFYGYPSAWRKIREANKMNISNDGRIRVGDTIKLP